MTKEESQILVDIIETVTLLAAKIEKIESCASLDFSTGQELGVFEAGQLRLREKVRGLQSKAHALPKG